MFDIGWSELIILSLVALIILGPEDMLKMANKLGKIISSLKKQVYEFKQSLNLDDENEDAPKQPKIIDLFGNEQDTYNIEDLKEELNKKSQIK